MASRAPLRAVNSLLVLLVLIAGSATGEAAAEGNTAGMDSGYCNSVQARSQDLQQRLEGRQHAVSSAWRRQTEQLQLYKTTQDEKVQDLRATVDAERAKNIEALRSSAANSYERQSVDAYATTVTQAVQTRRQAADEARTTFRKAVKTVIEDHQAEVSGQIQALKIGTGDAYTAAAASCGERVPSATVRTTLLQQLAASRQNFVGKRRADNETGQQITRLALRRREAVAAANAIFKTSVAAANQTLQRALGDKVVSTD